MSVVSSNNRCGYVLAALALFMLVAGQLALAAHKTDFTQHAPDKGDDYCEHCLDATPLHATMGASPVNILLLLPCVYCVPIAEVINVRGFHAGVYFGRAPPLFFSH